MNRDSQHQCVLTPVDPTSIESELRLAADPTTDPWPLRKLAYSDDPRIRELIAGNPNAPTEVLLQLGAEFPEQLLNNPVFPLLCLGELNEVDKIPRDTLCSLLQQPNVPEFVFEWGVKSQEWEAIGSLGMNPQTPKGILELLVQTTGNPEFAQVAKLHVNWDGEIAEGWEAIADQEMERFSNWNAASTFQEFKRLYEMARIGVKALPDSVIEQQAIAADPETPRLFLKTLSSSENFEIRLALAANPSTPSEILTKLAQEEHEWIHQAIAENPSTPPAVLTQFAKSSKQSVAVLEAITRHPNTPLTILKHLVSSKHPTVTQGAIENLYWETNFDPKWKTLYHNCLASNSPNLPSHLSQKLEKMAVNPDPEIRSQLAANPKTPPQILSQLAHDPDIEVRLALLNNPQISGRILGELICRELDHSPPTGSGLESSSLLGEILKDSEKDWIQMDIAGNPNTPKRLLRKLATRSDPRIRGEVAGNPHTPPDCLLKLAQDKNQGIQQTACQHPHAPLKALELYLQKIQDRHSLDPSSKGYAQSLLLEGLQEFIAIASRYVKRFPEVSTLVLEYFLDPTFPLNLRLLVLCYPDLSATALSNSSSSKYWMERYCIAQHPNTPILTLEQFAQDGNRLVRAAAKARLLGHP